MAGTAGLGLVAAGSARIFDFWRRLDTFAMANNSFWTRGGNPVNGVCDFSSNLGFPAHTEEVSFLGRLHCLRMRNGCKGTTIAGCPIVIDSTNVLVPQWPVGLWVYESAINCQIATPAGTENGMWFTIATGARPYNAAAGFGVNRRNNEIVFYTRGGLGLEEVVLDAVNPASWHMVRFELRSRSQSSEPTLRLYFDGALVINRSFAVAADNLPQTVAALGQTMFYPHWGIATAVATDWFYYRDQHWFCGPEQAAGVL